jgi:hypothetical protein
VNSLKFQLDPVKLSSEVNVKNLRVFLFLLVINSPLLVSFYTKMTRLNRRFGFSFSKLGANRRRAFISEAKESNPLASSAISMMPLILRVGDDSGVKIESLLDFFSSSAKRRAAGISFSSFYECF